MKTLIFRCPVFGKAPPPLCGDNDRYGFRNLLPPGGCIVSARGVGYVHDVGEFDPRATANLQTHFCQIEWLMRRPANEFQKGAPQA